MNETLHRLEEEFWTWWWLTTLSRRVVFGAIVGGPFLISIIPVFVVTLGFRPLPLCLLGLIGLQKMVLYFCLCDKPDFYQRRGAVVLLVCRVGGTATISYVGSQFGELAGDNTLFADLTLLAMLLSMLITQPYVCTTTFRVHLLAQTLSALAAVVFVLPLCDRCFAGDGWNAIFGDVSRLLDNFGTFLAALVGGSDNGSVIDWMSMPTRSPCRAVVAFAMLWVGWVLPSVAAYKSERVARLTFVRRSMLAHGFNDFNNGNPSPVTVLMRIVNSVLFFELSWRFLKACAENGWL